MMNQVNPKATLGCLITIVIVIFLVVYSTTASLNPLAVYMSDSILAKVVVTILAGLLAISLLQLLANYTLRKSIELGTGKPAEDLICPGCGLPLIQYMSSHGMPVKCAKCGRSWHSGPACFNRGLPRQYLRQNMGVSEI